MAQVLVHMDWNLVIWTALRSELDVQLCRDAWYGLSGSGARARV